MNASYLSGIVTTWAIVQVALGVFFLLAYVLVRREAEYRLFAVMSFAFSVDSIGVASMYAAKGPAEWRSGLAMAQGGTILAMGLNLLFVMRYVSARARPRLTALVLVSAVAFELLNFSGRWWVDAPLHARGPTWLGSLEQFTVTPTWLGWAAYAVAGIALAASVYGFARSTRGRGESRVALFGMSSVVVAGVNDVLVITGKVPGAVLSPHAFSIYAFCIATTLLYRYQSATGALQETSSSLARRTEELRHSYVELRNVQDELSRKRQLAAVGELAAAIAHEVRNPLAVIMNATAGLRRGVITPDDRDMLLSIVDEETARLNRLVTDLLRFARPVTIKRSQVSLIELGQRTRGVIKGDHEVDVRLEGPDEAAQIRADPNLLRLVFDNLVENACQAMPGGGTVTVVVRPGEQDGIAASIVEITDTGHGMDDQVLERATDPFFTTRPSGTGLGLPIVQRIIEAHGGRLDIESRQGSGTVVRMSFPWVPLE